MHFTTSTIALAATFICLSSTILAAPLVAPPTEPATTTAGARKALRPRQAPTTWQVANNCDAPMYYQSVSQEVTLIPDGYIAPHSTASGSYAADLDGLSVKLCADAAGCAQPYQFEVTVDLATSHIWYDLSGIDGDPFLGVPRTIFPADGSGPTFSCAPGDDSACAFTSPTVGPVGAADISAVIVAQFC